MQIAPGELFRLLQRNLGVCKHNGIYTPRLVIWMMTMQRLDPVGSLSGVVEQLAMGRLDGVLSRCKRVREGRISVSTGGYCQARQNLPKVLMERSVEEILQRLQNRARETQGYAGNRVYVLDGSSLQLEHCGELKEAYPPGANQYGEGHWPILRIVVLQDVETALAELPCWGAMYGHEAVSEQALAYRAIDRLAPGAVIIGDRNFGIFAMAYAIHQRGHDPVIRLTADRAVRLLGKAISQEGEYAVEWRAGRGDRLQFTDRPADAGLRGRLIAVRVGRGKSKQWLYLFTTSTLPVAEVVELYGRRWNVETDLRSLKQTARLQHLTARSIDIMEKELLAAVLAYNLVRLIMSVAAERRHVRPRQLSFTSAYTIVQIGISDVLAAGTPDEQMRLMDRMIELIGRSKLPSRKKRRSFPRAVWRPRADYPKHKTK